MQIILMVGWRKRRWERSVWCEVCLVYLVGERDFRIPLPLLHMDMGRFFALQSKKEEAR